MSPKWAVQGGDGYAAHIGGATGVSTDAQAEWWGASASGTVPHALIAAAGGDTVRAVSFFRETYPTTNLVALVDFDNDGDRDILGLWVGPSGGESPKFWLSVMTELRNRGLLDVLVVCCDGLKGLPDAARAAWPLVDVQLCVVHLVRNSLRYASKKHWGQITRQLKAIYTAPSLDAAETAFAEFTGDTFYAHMDEDAAAKNPFFEGRVAHGYLIVSFAAGLFVDPDFGPVLANYGVDDLRFAKPVNYGDSLKVRLTCKQKTLRAGTGYGEVRWDAEVTNQEDEVVAQYDVLTMVATDEQWAAVR